MPVPLFPLNTHSVYNYKIFTLWHLKEMCTGEKPFFSVPVHLIRLKNKIIFLRKKKCLYYRVKK